MIEDVKNFLSGMVELHRRIGRGQDGVKYLGAEDVVLQHGVQFTGVAKHTKLGTPRRCYNNAFDLVLNGVRRLHYCEGWACGVAQFPVQHAWCVDDAGLIYEPTWPQVEPTWHDRYVGCVFDDNFVFEEAIRKGMPGIFQDHVGRYDNNVLRGNFKLREGSW